MKTKTCPTCGTEKNIDAFYVSKQGYTSSSCKVCTTNKMKIKRHGKVTRKYKPLEITNDPNELVKDDIRVYHNTSRIEKLSQRATSIRRQLRTDEVKADKETHHKLRCELYALSTEIKQYKEMH